VADSEDPSGSETETESTEQPQGEAPAESTSDQGEDQPMMGEVRLTDTDNSGDDGESRVVEGDDREALDPVLMTAGTAAGYDEDETRELVQSLGIDRARKLLERQAGRYGSLLQGAGGDGEAAPGSGNTGGTSTPAGAAGASTPKVSDIAALTEAELTKLGEEWGDPALVNALVKPLNDRLAKLVDVIKGLDIEELKGTVEHAKQTRGQEYQKTVDGWFDKFAANGWAKVVGDSKKPNYETRKAIHNDAVALRTTVIARGGQMTGEQALAAILNSKHAGQISKPEATRQAVTDLQDRVERRSRQLSIPPRGSAGAVRRPASPQAAKDAKVSNIREFFNARARG